MSAVSGLALAGFLSLVGITAACASRFRPGPWYTQLLKPRWTPPNRVFPIAWGLLYVMMAMAAWFFWRMGAGPMLWAGLGLWGMQLVANGLWSWLFFKRRAIGWALADLAWLLISVAGTVGVFCAVDWFAAIFLIPYLLWLVFAGMLNGWIWYQNRGL